MKITKTVAIGSTQNEYILHQTKNEIRNFKAMPFAEISERVVSKPEALPGDRARAMGKNSISRSLSPRTQKPAKMP